MPRYNFIFERGSVVYEGSSLGDAYAKFQNPPKLPDLGTLRTVECGVAADPDPEMTFIININDLCLRVEADAQAGSGDGWNEPREPAMVWTYRVWYNTKFDGTGQWVGIETSALNPTIIEWLNDEASDRYLSDIEANDGPDRTDDD